MATFPSTLPVPIRDSFSSSLKQSLPGVPMDDGRSRFKRRFSVQPKTFRVTWRFTWDQLALFEAFLEYEVKRGSDWFTLVLFYDLPAMEVRIVGGEDGGYSVNFNSNGSWDVSANLEYMLAAPNFPVSSGTLPEWIQNFPEPEQSNYGYSYKDSVLRTKIETGMAEQRHRFFERVTQYRLAWILDSEQKSVFEYYVRNILIDGTSWFIAPFINGAGTANVKARFISAPVVSPLGAAYNVSANLMTTNAPMMSQAEYDALIAGSVNTGQSWDNGVYWDNNTPWI